MDRVATVVSLHLLVACALVGSACHEGGEGDPCNGVECSGHGACRSPDGARAVCNCDEGYHVDGLECIADPADGDADADADGDGDADGDADGQGDADADADGSLPPGVAEVDCASGTCRIVRCERGFGDCNEGDEGGYDDGCEVPVPFGTTSGEPLWVATFGGAGSEQVHDLVVMPRCGDIVAAGLLAGTFTYGDDRGGPRVDSSGGNDAWVARIRPSSLLSPQSFRAFGGVEHDVASAVAVDGSGVAYLGGSFSEVVDFGGGDRTTEDLEEHSTDGFVAAYRMPPAPEGEPALEPEYLWDWTFGEEEEDRVEDVVVDDAGLVFATGSYKVATDLTGVRETTIDVYSNAFVARLGGAPVEVQWAETYGTSGSDTGHSLALAGDDLLYVGGTVASNLECTGGTILDGAGFMDFFAIGMSRRGGFPVCDWYDGFGGLSRDEAFAMAVDPTRSMLVLGGQYFDSATVREEDLVASGNQDGLALAWSFADVEAPALIWHQAFGGDQDAREDPAKWDVSRAVAVSSREGVIFVAGAFLGTADLGCGEHTSAGYTDGFIAAYSADGSGECLWDHVFGAESLDLVLGLAVDDEQGVLYAAGYFSRDVSFGVGGTRTAGSGREAFVLALGIRDEP